MLSLPPSQSSLLRINDIDKSRLQTRPTNEEPIDVRLLRQVLTVLLADAATVDDACVLADGFIDLLSQELSHRGVDVLGLGGGGDFAGADCPSISRVSEDNLQKEEDRRPGNFQHTK